MYFDSINLFDVEKYVSDLDYLYAHLKDDGKETLKDHMELVYNYFLKICEDKNLDNIILELQNKLLQNQALEVVDLWKELLCNAIYMHDMGKINSDFQFMKMQNERFKNTFQINSKHSMLSACIYFDYYFTKIKKIKGEGAKVLLLFLTLNSYIISKHHGSLDDFASFKDSFLNGYKFYSRNKKLYSKYRGELKINLEKAEPFFDMLFKEIKNMLIIFENRECWKSIDMYIYSRLLFSLLTDSDFYATSDYQTQRPIENFGTIKNIENFYNIFKQGKIYNYIEKYREFLKGNRSNPFKEGDINRLRTEMFLEAEENLIKNLDENIFYLEAPTGSGKTNTSINLAFKFIEKSDCLNKIFYIFPFNTLVEQTKRPLDDIFDNNDNLKRNIAVINSITPILTEDIEEDNNNILNFDINKKVNYDKALLDRQFLHYPIVLTTHVNFFTHLFGNSREAVFPIAHIANSVIILDEIQSYKNSIWKEIIIFLKKYANILNIKIIIMSATLPKLEELVSSNEHFIQLIENRSKYFEDPLFKNRVELDFSLLDADDVKKVILDKVSKLSKTTDKNILIEFINKKTAMGFFKELVEIKKELKRKVLLITGDDNKVERNRIISLVKKEKNIVLISTQVIEAGVDIDMDIGFKDISILDAEEQFLGRINRSCKKNGCKVYFFNLDDAKTIYKGDYRKDKSITLLNQPIRGILQDKDFYKFYNIVMDKIDKGLKKEDSRNIDEFRKEIISNLKYEDIRKRMNLIDDDRKEYSIFLSRDIELESGERIRGSEVWDEYYRILTNSSLGYAERKVKLSRVIEKMGYFTYKINKMNLSYNKVIGNIFYIEDGEKYFINDKFDRELIEKNEGFEIITL